MPPTYSLDWLFLTIGYTLAAAGALLLLWSLFYDRARNRRRCPKCWYDMAGVPGLRCPECGSESPTEKRLTRTRRHWRPATLALLTTCCGIAVANFPDYRRAGWAGTIPTIALIWLAPIDEPIASPNWPASGASPTGTKFLNFPITAAAAPLPTWPEQLHDEMWGRVQSGTLWRWNAALFAHRYLALHPADAPERCLRCPLRWVPGRPLPVFGTPWQGVFSTQVRVAHGPWTAFRSAVAPVGISGPALIETRLVYGGIGVRTSRLPDTVEFRDSPDHLLDRMETPEWNRRVGALLRPRLRRSGGAIALEFDDGSVGDDRRTLDFGVHFTIEVRVHDKPVLRGRSQLVWGSGAMRQAGLTWLAPVNAQPVNWADLVDSADIVLQGDPASAALEYLEQTRRLRPACWAGTLSLRVRSVEDLVKPPAPTGAP